MKRSSRAQSLVEFAVVVPVFLLLLFGLIDFARLVFTYVSLTDGARELARTASISQAWSTNPTAANASAIAAFNNYTVVLGSQNSATDSITFTVANANCAHALDTGGTCSSPNSPSQATCSLLLSAATCTLPQPKAGGFLQVQVAYTFQFNPLFQNRLSNVVDVSLMQPTAAVTTTSRAYTE